MRGVHKAAGGWVAAWLVLAAPACLWAQTLPGAADPARSVPDAPSPQETFEQQREDARPVPVQNGLLEVPEGAAAERFSLNGLTVEGMQAFAAADILPDWEDYRGKEVSLATLYEIAARLQRRYAEAGYALSKVSVPEQPGLLLSGQARLAVVEGHVVEVDMDPALPQTPALIDAVERIRAMQPLNTRMLERLLMILNSLPDTHISAILASPSAADAEPGALRLVVRSNGSPLARGRVSLDNFGSRYSGPWQGMALGHVYDAGLVNSDLALGVSSALPYREQHYATLSYIFPLMGASGLLAKIEAVWARTQPGDSLEPLKIEGETRNVSAGLSYPLIRQRAENWMLDGGVEAKNAQTDLLGSRLYNDRLRVVSLGTSYNFSDALGGFNALDVHARQGLGLLGASESRGNSLSRADGDPTFTKFNFFAGRSQSLAAGFELYGLISGQYAFNPLLSSEEFGFGGGQAGRGYDPSELTGDHGLSGTLEMRYNREMVGFGQQFSAQPFVFYDAGKVWNIDRGTKNQDSAASAGGGVRLNVNGQWDSTLLLATPLTRPADNPPQYANGAGTRLLISVSRGF